MEFKLNKIDTDLRERIKEKTSDGKVHRKAEIQIDKFGKREGNNKKFSLPKKESKNVNVLAVKTKKNSNSIDVDAFNKEKRVEDITKGSFLDVRK